MKVLFSGAPVAPAVTARSSFARLPPDSTEAPPTQFCANQRWKRRTWLSF